MADNHDKIEKEAVDEALLLRYVKGKVNYKETYLVENWLGDNRKNRRILAEIAILNHINQSSINISNKDPLIGYNITMKRINRRTYINILKYVAPVAATILLFILFDFFREPSISPTVAQQKIIIHTNPGMRTTIDLPDGSLVNLNSSSTLTYNIPFEDSKRAVHLEGEAYFDVFTDKERPFVVNLLDSSKKVVATGTEFNIQAYSKETFINTILVEGTVKFISKEADGKENKQYISPSERIIYNNKSGTILIDSVNTYYYTSWKEGKLIFQETPMMDVLYRLSHFYDVKFEIANREILSYSFTGTFENRQLSQVLDYLYVSSGIKYEMVQTTEDDNSGVKRNKVILK